MSASTHRQTRDTRYRQFKHPRWWPTWFYLSLMFCLAHLPLRFQWWLGKGIGEIAYRTMAKRRHITTTNIRACFPEKTQAEQQALVRQSYHANGIGIMEIGLAWFRKPERFRPITRVHGLEHYESALEAGNGILLLGGHYSTLDLGGSLISLVIDADVMQRDHNNPLVNAVMTRARERRYGTVLASKDLRGLFRCLKANRPVWYATDQDYGRNASVFAPFFGIPAASITTTSRIAERTGCAVVPFSHFRRDGAPGYDIYFHPPLANFPSGDDQVDAGRVNAVIEQEIRRHPDQYLWMHRRFKTRPSPEDPDFYRKPDHGQDSRD